MIPTNKHKQYCFLSVRRHFYGKEKVVQKSQKWCFSKIQKLQRLTFLRSTAVIIGYNKQHWALSIINVFLLRKMQKHLKMLSGFYLSHVYSRNVRLQREKSNLCWPTWVGVWVSQGKSKGTFPSKPQSHHGYGYTRKCCLTHPHSKSILFSFFCFEDVSSLPSPTLLKRKTEFPLS